MCIWAFCVEIFANCKNHTNKCSFSLSVRQINRRLSNALRLASKKSSRSEICLGFRFLYCRCRSHRVSSQKGAENDEKCDSAKLLKRSQRCCNKTRSSSLVLSYELPSSIRRSSLCSTEVERSLSLSHSHFHSRLNKYSWNFSFISFHKMHNATYRLARCNTDDDTEIKPRQRKNRCQLWLRDFRHLLVGLI